MSIEQALADNTATMKELIATLQASQEQQKAILGKIEGSVGKPTATRTPRAAKGETAEEPTKTPPAAEPEATKPATFQLLPNYQPKTVSDFIAPWLQETDDKDIRQQRSDFIKAALSHLGFSKLSEVDNDDARKQLAFFVTMKREGFEVNFSADYDFDADPLAQGVAKGVEEPADTGEFDPLA